jgi:hypothetical protein
MSSVSSVGGIPIYAPPESRNEPKHDNDADDRGPKALAAAASSAPTSAALPALQLSSQSLAALIAMQTP